MGPALDLYLPLSLTAPQVAELHHWIVSISRDNMRLEPMRPARDRWERALEWTFWVHDGAAIGMPGGLATSCALYLTLLDPALDPEMELEPGLRSAVIAALGALPPTQFNLFAGCNDPLDHLTLGYVALQVLETYGGVVYVDSALTAGEMAGPATRALADRDTTSAGVSASREFVRTLPGRTYEIPQSPGDYGTPEWAQEIAYAGPLPNHIPTHLIDATCLRAWLKHPTFHFIK